MSRSSLRWSGTGAVIAGLAVLAGAFGAHALGARLGTDSLAIWETAARYQMYHGLALLASGALPPLGDVRLVRTARRFFLAGVVLFSGSLYALALSGVAALGAITPLGGAALLAGWACLAVALVRARPADASTP
jgi:uncharacterized membrane protein YgdD (TMEM256/DUF423 family)